MLIISHNYNLKKRRKKKMNQVKTNNSCCCIPIFLIKFWLFIGGGIHVIIGCVFMYLSSVF